MGRFRLRLRKAGLCYVLRPLFRTRALAQSKLDPALPPFTAAWDNLRRPVWVFDPQTCFGLYANPAAMELWGAETLDELLSRDFSKLSPAVRTRVERLAQATAKGEAVIERWSFYPRGEPLTVQAVISSLVLTDGRQALLFEAAPVDVEEGERRAVEALRHTSSLITLFDAEGRAVFSNPAAFAAYGEAELGLGDRFTDEAHGPQILKAVLAGEVLAELSRVRTCKGERWHHLDARTVVDPVTGVTGVLLSERDVTAQIEAEERADTAEAKERFLANMSHELRTPLNSVIGFAGLLKGADLAPEQSRYVDHISTAGEALLTVVNDLIELSELDVGEVRLDEAAFDPVVVVRHAVDDFERAAEAKGLTLDVEICRDAPVEVIGDATRLGRVLRHYLSNAVKFTERGGVRVALSTARSKDGAALEIAVVDTGPGVAPRDQARLFRRFSQADPMARRTVGGGGLGLAVSRELMALMGGEAGVESEPGEGARFWLRVTLPLAEGAGEGEAPEAAALRVLYADDHQANRVLIQAMLGAHGHGCDLACDGAEAVRMAKVGGYDLILMDIQMPVLDGVGAAREIRAFDGPEGRVPILALTANTLSDQVESYLAAGMQDCIAKPVNMAELLQQKARWDAAASLAPGPRKSSATKRSRNFPAPALATGYVLPY